jgi:serine/threonine protein kinase
LLSILLTFFYSLDEKNYSLVLEYADSGTLENYLRKNAKTFDWRIQLKFAIEIARGISCLHDHKIVHGDLVSFVDYYVLLYLKYKHINLYHIIKLGFYFLCTCINCRVHILHIKLTNFEYFMHG